MQRGHHIRPQLGFHNDNQLRLNGIQEAVHGAGQIVGQIDVMDIFAERRHGALGAGRRHGGDGDRHRRVAVAQSANQRNGGQGFSDGNGVQQNAIRLYLVLTEAIAFRPAFTIGRSLTTAQQQPQPHQRLNKVK